MKCPLVPLDGSADARRALAYALSELRDVPAATLHVVNVQPPPIHPWPGKLVSPDVIEQERRREGNEIVQAAEAAARDSGIRCIAHVRIGLAAHEIAACAVEQHCDAIVMGTRGRGRVAGVVLGSVAHQVVHLATVPVTLLK
jgi:nucleotide-binding universal stress UspA family protein